MAGAALVRGRVGEAEPAVVPAVDGNEEQRHAFGLGQVGGGEVDALFLQPVLPADHDAAAVDDGNNAAAGDLLKVLGLARLDLGLLGDGDHGPGDGVA